MEPLAPRVRPQPERRMQSLLPLWIVFSPIVPHALAAAIDVRTLTSSLCHELPVYLSLKSRAAIRLIAIFTYVNVFASAGLCFSSYLVLPASQELKAHFDALNSTVPDPDPFKYYNGTSSSYNAHVQQIPPLISLAWWLKACLGLLLFRTAARLYVHWDIQTRSLSIIQMARIEFTMDNLLSSSMMLCCSYNLRRILWTFNASMLVSYGVTEFQANFGTFSMWIFVDSWFADVAFRVLWICISWVLDADFLESHAYRWVAMLPTVTSSELCPICLDDAQTEFCQMPCAHIFHRDCMLTWVRSHSNSIPCPMCRAVLTQSGYSFSSLPAAS